MPDRATGRQCGPGAGWRSRAWLRAVQQRDGGAESWRGAPGDPCAHDCISFLGFRRRYVELFNKRWGTTYYTSGWLERGGDSLLQPSE